MEIPTVHCKVFGDNDKCIFLAKKRKFYLKTKNIVLNPSFVEAMLIKQ